MIFKQKSTNKDLKLSYTFCLLVLFVIADVFLIDDSVGSFKHTICFLLRHGF